METPAGIRIHRHEDGAIVLDLPVSEDRFLRWFLVFFALPFLAAGIALLASRQMRAYVRTNGRPTSWSLVLIGSGELAGAYSEPTVLWLGNALATWSGKPFDAKLDKSYQSD